MKITAINKECEIEDSKLFGEVYLPDEWLEKDIFSPFEFFLCQINLEDFKLKGLPSKGYLYFFIEAISLAEKKMKAKVRYYENEPDAYTDFNDGYFDCETLSYKLEELFDEDNSKNLEILNLCEECDNFIKLLELPSKLLPFKILSSKIAFIIDKIAFKNLKFESSSLIFINQ